MELRCLGSGSAGNSYVIQNETECIILEVGVKFGLIQKAVDYNISKINGILLSHEDCDHSLSISYALNLGIDVYSSEGTFRALGVHGHHRAKAIQPETKFKIGGFTVKSFDVVHDAAQPFGYLVHHIEMGTLLFLTDTHYIPYIFKNINHYLIEANYSESVLNQKLENEQVNLYLRNRIITAHMSFETCKEFLKNSNLNDTLNIVLIHLSDSNSDERKFKREITEMTGIPTYIAEKGLTIDLSNNPF